MRFNRYGKSFQMVIENGNDLEDALKLDEALWGAISAPNAAFACDPRLLELMDSDKKGRITSTDVKDAIRWLLEQLPDHSAIKPDFDGKLPLDSINATSDTGKALVESAKYILGELKASDTASITLAQIREFIATVNARSLNGDGVITPKAAADKAVTDSAAIVDLVNDAVTATGGVQDIDGSMGMDMKTMDTFLAEVPKYLDWLDKGAIPAGQQKTDLMPFGADTGALAALVKANAPKVNQFFELCRLTQFDSRIQAKALATDAKVAAFDPANTADVTAYQKDMPLSVPQPDGVLPFEHEKINPAYISDFSALVAKVAKPILGNAQEGMTQADWDKITATFAPYEAYMASKAGACVEKIPVERLRTYLEAEALIAEVKRLMVADAKVADTVKAAREVERLLLYRGNLLRLANNFICFSELYSPTAHALFECGKVVIDGRWFSVAFKVESPAAHQALAKTSQLFLMYMDVNLGGGKKMTIVLPVTSGSKGNLSVGKRGVFYDHEGRDYDATIVQLQENPVCIREALLAPFSKFWGIIEGKIMQWQAKAEAAATAGFTNVVEGKGAANAAAVPGAAAAKPEEKKDGGMGGGAMLGMGVAFAALGSAFAFISKTVAGMTGFQIWMMVIILLLALLLPLSIIAIIQLNRQDLSSVLEGCGWGINLRLRLDTKLRSQFTYTGKYPANAEGTPKSYWLKVLIFILLLIICISGGCKYYAIQKAKAEAAKAEAVKVEEAKKAAEAAKVEEAKKAEEVKKAAEAAKQEAEKKAAEPAPAPAAKQ